MPSGSRSTNNEFRSCFQVTAKLSRAIAVHQRSTLNITVRAAVARDDVAITADLPPNLRWVTPPTGTTTSSRVSKAPHAKGIHQLARTTRSMRAGQTLRYQGVVEAVAAGTAEITVTATTNPSANPLTNPSARPETGSDRVFLTVGQTAAESRLGIAKRQVDEAVPYTGPKPTVKAAPAKARTMTPIRPAKKPAAQVSPKVATKAATADAPSAETGASRVLSAGATACVTGTWNYVDANGVGQPGAFWTVEVWDDDGNTGDDLLASGLSGWSGEYTLCFDNGDENGTGQDVYVVFRAISNAWLVQDNNGNIYGAQTWITWNVADGGTTNLGGLQQADATYFRVGAAFEGVKDVWFATPGGCWDDNNRCEYVRVRWEPTSTDGTYYSLGDKQIHLAAADPDNAWVVAHETAHSIMDDAYDYNFPAFSCPSPHYVNVASEVGCAWVEGFAEWMGDAVTGGTWMENTAGWDTGDITEGRVAGALYDLWDGTNEGTDRTTEGMNSIWTTLQNHNSGTFRDFWNSRAADGFDVGNNALGSLYQNSIDYGFRP